MNSSSTRRRVRLLPVLLCFTLGACSSVLTGGYESADQSPFFLVPRGTVIVLTRDVTIPANRVKTFFQGGRQLVAPNQYEPFCRLEVLPLKPQPQLVKADRFVVQRAVRIEDAFASYQPRWQRVNAGRRWLWWRNDPPSPVIFGTRMYLGSPTQPDVYRLMCGYLQEPILGARHLTVDQMRQALGESFRIELAHRV